MSELRTIDGSFACPASPPDPGSPPMLQWIEIALLRVDPRYQRDLRPDNVRAIGRIAEGFDWSKFSTVHVAPIEGGLYAIIDGQHRTHAAAAIGAEKVPCQVTHMNLRQQASAFAAINGLAMQVTPIQVFRAALAAEEAWAVEVRKVCEDAGCVAMTYNISQRYKKAGEIHAIGYLRKLIGSRGAGTATKALGILRRAEGVGDTIEAYAYGRFRPILEALASRPHALRAPDRAVDLLELFDFGKFEREVDRMADDTRRTGGKAVGRAELMEAVVGTALDRGLSLSGGAA